MIAEFRARIAGIMNGGESEDYLSYASNRNKSPAWALRGADAGPTPAERMMIKRELSRLFNQCAQALEEAFAEEAQ